MKHLYLLILLSLSGLVFGQTSIPIDFENDPGSYVFNDFGGGVGSVIANPDASGINTSSQVCQVVKNEGEVFGGTTIALDSNIDFGDSNAFKMKVWANRTDAPVLFKLEGPTPVEVAQTPTTASTWEELTFSFAGLTGNEYTAITIIYDLGVVGDGGPNFTIYLDDIELTTAEGGVAIPIGFEDPDLMYEWNDFEGGVATVIDNPDQSGINTSSKVGQMVKFEGAVFGGSTLPLGTPVDFGSNNAIKMKVWANRVDAPVTFKLEGPAPVEFTENTTVANQWEELVYDFTGFTDGTYTGITIIYDLGTVGDGSADFTLYFDDIDYAMIEGSGVTIPIDFESTEIEYNWNDFEGGVVTVIDNPDQSGINTSNRVGQMVKFEGAEFGGSTLPVGSIDFGDNNAITMKVWANRTDAPVLFKLEGPAPVEVSQNTTVANQWEELTFDFTGFTDATYTGITIIYDLGTVGDGSADFTLYFDDINYATIDGEALELPIDFESMDIEYNWNDFEGGVVTVIDNPDQSGINTSSRVAQMVKFEGETFGGSTLTLGTLEFGDNSAIEMKVWANRVDAPVLFKLEGPTPVEVSQNTTVANQWETLTFDFSGNTDATYTGITIIYDLGTVGDGSADFTLYFDDIAFAGTSSTRDLQELGIEYFPNPMGDMLTVQSTNMIDEVRIYNISGQQVLAQKTQFSTAQIDVSGLAPGAYVLNVRSGDREGTAKLIKQ